MLYNVPVSVCVCVPVSVCVCVCFCVHVCMPVFMGDLQRTEKQRSVTEAWNLITHTVRCSLKLNIGFDTENMAGMTLQMGDKTLLRKVTHKL